MVGFASGEMANPCATTTKVPDLRRRGSASGRPPNFNTATYRWHSAVERATAGHGSSHWRAM
jgi:hypothetical protein